MSFIDDVRKVYGEEGAQDYLRRLRLRTYDIPPILFTDGLPKVEEYTKPDGTKARIFASDFGIIGSTANARYDPLAFFPAEDPDKLNIQVMRKFNIKFNFKD